MVSCSFTFPSVHRTIPKRHSSDSWSLQKTNSALARSQFISTNATQSNNISFDCSTSSVLPFCHPIIRIFRLRRPKTCTTCLVTLLRNTNNNNIALDSISSSKSCTKKIYKTLHHHQLLSNMLAYLTDQIVSPSLSLVLHFALNFSVHTWTSRCVIFSRVTHKHQHQHTHPPSTPNHIYNN